MSISAHDITNVLRTYHALLNLKKDVPSGDDYLNPDTADIINISVEGKKRLQTDQANKK